ncbi:MAG: T9SS type A sorting domain-containing protein [Bacteroidales bacterium]|nr:T9SS type A sorting domain-containing protein [Bacteroidales bacterium]MDT8431940.1 T9SS type A sorting domain-containing protein [Bacteroidales bacterium]
MKKQLLTIATMFIFMLFAGWTAQAQEYHFQEGFATNDFPPGWSGIEIAWSSSSTNAHNEFEGDYCAKPRPTDAELVTKPVNGAGKLSFWLKVKDNTAGGVLDIDKSTDGMETWTTVTTDPQDNNNADFQFIEVDINDASTEVYIRLHQTSTGGSSSTGIFTIDDISLTKLPPSADDATLTGITINGEALATFALSVNDYAVELPYGSDEIVVEATPNNSNATVNITQVANPYGSEAERTATISVTSEDESVTQDYNIVFTVSDYHFKTGFSATGESVAPFPGWIAGYTYVSTNIAIASGNHGEYPGDAAFKFIRGQEDKAGYLISSKYTNAGTLSFWLAVEAADGSETLKVEKKVGFGLNEEVAEYTSAELTDEWQLFSIDIMETDSVQFTFTPTMTTDGDVRIWMDDLALTGFPVVSAKDVISKANIRLYPNPASDYLRVDLKNEDFSQVNIFSVSGQNVLERTIDEREFFMDVSSLKTGIYFARFTGASGTYAIKLVKQ